MGLFGSLFGSSAGQAPAGTSALDVVTYVGSLASDTAAVDPVLDAVRAMSAKLQPGQPLSSKDQQTLVQVYQKLAQHLATKEALRPHTPDALYAKVTEKFHPSAADDPQFWQAILPAKASM